ncbi:MAG: hypothetical protein BAA01_00960 [Bacillus thermozeamaize]|uniref:Peptidylprolyl isomerase n=1 Tax=Bacillus thermozeamaize TaxID=230954 RepID=A0A1Y3PAS0_9BACI|nr:MAG: hypothetical protein BAA01_00960 [Bacillus thermozeamaize]
MRKHLTIALSMAVLLIAAAAAVIYAVNNHSPEPQTGVKLLGVESVGPLRNDLSKEQIQSFIDSAYKEYVKKKAESLHNVNPDAVLVQGKDFAVTAREFIEYKYQKLFIERLNETIFDHTVVDGQLKDAFGTPESKTGNLSNQELLRHFLSRYVLASHAKERGISVSRQELDDYIAFTKNALSGMDANTDMESDFTGKAFFEALLKMNGWTEEEYWELPKVREGYERDMLQQKLEKQLIETGKVGNHHEFLAYADKILDSAIKKLDVRWDLLDNIP